ncbi:MAG: acetyltransferase [Tissierellia bacterium]|nr:acetyltransferase [Tissierellia bacterium]
MREEKVLVVGSSGHAKVIIDILEKNNKEVIGVIDDFRKKNDKTFDYNVLGGIVDIPSIVDSYNCKIIIGIGDNFVRKEITNKLSLLKPNIEYISAIHPSAQIGKNVYLGVGIVVMAGAIINAEAKIGNNTFINTNSSIGHDVVMCEFSSVAPGVTVGGNVTIGEASAISIGATIKEKIKIGSNSIIGAGSLLLSDCPNDVVMYGTPAKVIRNRRKGDKYL